MTVSILIFLPVIAALVVLFVKGNAAKYAAFTFTLAELVITCIFLSRFVPNAATQFSVTVPWIPKAGIYFNAGIDGISMIMVLLTTLLMPISVLSMRCAPSATSDVPRCLRPKRAGGASLPAYGTSKCKRRRLPGRIA